MIVELIGSPGAGKTTLLPSVEAFFEEVGLTAYAAVDAARPCARRTLAGALVTRLAPPALHRPLLWQIFYRSATFYRLKFIAQHPRLAWDLYRAQRRRPPEADVRRRRVVHWFFHHVGAYEFFKAYGRPEEVIIFDEGFAHRVVQLFTSAAEAPDAEQIAAYLAQVPRPNLLIAILASHETCQRRVYHRGLRDTLRDKEAGTITTFIENAHLAVNLAVAWARDNGWNVVDVDNDSDDLPATRLALRRRIALGIPLGDTGIYLGAI